MPGAGGIFDLIKEKAVGLIGRGLPWIKNIGAAGAAAGRAGWEASKAIYGAGRGVARVGGAVRDAAKTIWGPAGFGIAGMRPGLGRRLIVPGILVGGYAAYGAASNLLEGEYSMHSPMAAQGFTRGISEPYEELMEFGGSNNTFRELQAGGSLAFALHNRRKA